MAWLSWPLGAMCVLVGAFHIGLFVTGRSGFAPAAVNAVMGIGMAAMFVPAADPVPRPLWVAAFVVIAAWSAAASVRGGSLLGDAGHHTVCAVTMLVMLLGHADGAAGARGPVDPGHAHHGGAADAAAPLLLSAIALVLAAWFLTDIARRVVRPSADLAFAALPEQGAGTAAHRPSRPAVRRGPRIVPPGALSHVVMSAAMTVMVLGMV